VFLFTTVATPPTSTTPLIVQALDGIIALAVIATLLEDKWGILVSLAIGVLCTIAYYCFQFLLSLHVGFAIGFLLLWGVPIVSALFVSYLLIPFVYDKRYFAFRVASLATFSFIYTTYM
jgi:hypothetical protein